MHYSPLLEGETQSQKTYIVFLIAIMRYFHYANLSNKRIGSRKNQNYILDNKNDFLDSEINSHICSITQWGF